MMCSRMDLPLLGSQFFMYFVACFILKLCPCVSPLAFQLLLFFIPSSQHCSVPSLTCSFPASVHLFPVPLLSVYAPCSPSMSLSVHSVLFAYSVFVHVRWCCCSVFPAVSPPVSPHVSPWCVSGFCSFCFYIDFYFVFVTLWLSLV